MTEKKRKANHYVDNKKLFDALVVYKQACVAADAEGKQFPPIPPYVGECVMKIATHLAFKPNLFRYTFRDEMVSDGVENCLQYIHNFDPTKSQNPFAYFTQIIYFAFIRRIQKEKKYLYTKHVATQLAEITNITSDQQEHDNGKYRIDTSHGEWSQEQMQTFMEDFEKSKRKRRKKKLDNTERVS